MNERIKEIQSLANKLESLKEFEKNIKRENYILIIAKDDCTVYKRFPNDPESREFVKRLLTKHLKEINKEISEEINRVDNYLNNNFR